MVEAEGRVEELDPRVPAPSRSTHRFGSNGKQPGWWRPREEQQVKQCGMRYRRFEFYFTAAAVRRPGGVAHGVALSPTSPLTRCGGCAAWKPAESLQMTNLAAGVVEAEARVEELDPLVSALSRSGR